MSAEMICMVMICMYTAVISMVIICMYVSSHQICGDHLYVYCDHTADGR